MTDTKGSEDKNITATPEDEAVTKTTKTTKKTTTQKTSRSAAAAKKTAKSTTDGDAGKTKPTADKKTSGTAKKDSSTQAAARKKPAAKAKSAAQKTSKTATQKTSDEGAALSAQTGQTSQKADGTEKETPAKKSASSGGTAGTATAATTEKKTASKPAAPKKSGSKAKSTKPAKTADKATVTDPTQQKTAATSASKETGDKAKADESAHDGKEMGMLEGSRSLPLQGSKSTPLPSQKQQAIESGERLALENENKQALKGSDSKALKGKDQKELQGVSTALPAGEEDKEKPAQGKKKTTRQTAKKTAAKDKSDTDASQKTKDKSITTQPSPAKQPDVQEDVAGKAESKEAGAPVSAETPEASETSDSRNIPDTSDAPDTPATPDGVKDSSADPATPVAGKEPATPAQSEDDTDKPEAKAGDNKPQEKKSGARPSRQSARSQGNKSSQSKKELQKKNDAAASSDETKAEAKSASDKKTAPAKADASGKGDSQSKKNQSTARGPRRKMFVSVLPAEQVEVVITEEGQIQEYYVEMLQQQKTKGNIYKATIHNIDANLQAAFVNYGANKNGFLQIDEVHPEYYNVPHDESSGRRYPPIQKVLKPGQELLVQVVKEPNASKGAFLTTYLSLAGRFLVLTPGREQIGVSRKVENDEERGRLREMLEDFKPGAGLGVIVRTVSMGINKATLKKDLQTLKTTWKEVRKLGTEEKAPKLIYEEIGLATRSVRDYLNDQIVEVWIDDAETAQDVEKLAATLFPKKNKLVHVHTDVATSLFERFNLQRQLDQIQSREVALPSGGRLVIDTTEALTAIDINSGRSGGKTNFEDMAFRTNMEAAKMIPLQLRLRDIGGQVVCDFIEMRDRAHWREVEKTVRAAMKGDRARHDIGKISSFGLLELVRQRLGSSAISANMEVCPHCKGSGVRRNMEWQCQQALKEIARRMRAAKEQKQSAVEYAVDLPIAMQLLNSKRQRLNELEDQLGVKLEITLLED